MFHLRPQLVLDERDAYIMAQIRNEGRQWMTRDQSFIDSDRQRAWFHSIDRNVTLPWLFHDGEPVAYGLMHRDAGRWWLTVGVRTAYHNRGYGTGAFSYMQGLVYESWLEVREDNHSAIKVYKKLGYEEWTRNAGVISMSYRRPGS